MWFDILKKLFEEKHFTNEQFKKFVVAEMILPEQFKLIVGTDYTF